MITNSNTKLGILQDAVAALQEVINTSCYHKDITKAIASDYEVEASHKVIDYKNGTCDLCVKFAMTPKEKFVVEKLDIELLETEMPLLAKAAEKSIFASMVAFDAVKFDITLTNGSSMEVFYTYDDYIISLSIDKVKVNIDARYNNTFAKLIEDIDTVCSENDWFMTSFMQEVGRVDAGRFNEDFTVMQYEYESDINRKTIYNGLEKAKVYETQVNEAGIWSIDCECGLYTDISTIYGKEVAEEVMQNMLKRLNEQDTTHRVYITR